MAKTIFEELGGKYERQGDYLIPCIALPAEEQPIGVWGERHLRYLKEYRRGTYINLLTVVGSTPTLRRLINRRGNVLKGS